MKTIAIIGGGAAGLMTAATLIETGAKCEIHLFERNPSLGAKVIISGGGRCNVTTGITDKKVLLSKYTRGSAFLKTALYDFSPEKVYEWFEDNGVPLKVEEDMRVFPKSDHGRDVVGTFEKMFHGNDLQIHLSEWVHILSPTADQFTLETNKDTYVFDFVVITTGGNAYQHTGSKGDGYAFAVACGHSITKLGPSLNSFLTQEDWPKKLSGISFENARLETVAEDGEKKSAIGPIIFTHFGISGPATFALSSHLAFTTVSKEHPHLISITPLADRTYDKYEEEFRGLFQEQGSKHIHNVLGSMLPKRFVEALLELTKIPSDKKCAELSKEDRKNIIHLLTGKLTLHLIQRRPGDEFVTAGGVKLSEVDEKTMKSKKHPHLFFAGEILDVDGVTGGYNLQASWATGRLAGKSLSKMLLLD